MKIFDLWEIDEIKVEDIGLKRYVNLDAKLILKSRGKERERFGKGKVNIIERLVALLTVPGHRGKKHKVITRATGKYNSRMMDVISAFKIIEKQVGKNPVEVFVKAVENSAQCDETTTIEYGGAKYLQAVDSSPMRRVNIALRNLVHGSYDKSFKKKVSIAQALAAEIVAAYNQDSGSHAFSKRQESEKQANAAR